MVHSLLLYIYERLNGNFPYPLVSKKLYDLSSLKPIISNILLQKKYNTTHVRGVKIIALG